MCGAAKGIQTNPSVVDGDWLLGLRTVKYPCACGYQVL